MFDVCTDNTFELRIGGLRLHVENYDQYTISLLRDHLHDKASGVSPRPKCLLCTLSYLHVMAPFLLLKGMHQSQHRYATGRTGAFHLPSTLVGPSDTSNPESPTSVRESLWSSN